MIRIHPNPELRENIQPEWRIHIDTARIVRPLFGHDPQVTLDEYRIVEPGAQLRELHADARERFDNQFEAERYAESWDHGLLVQRRTVEVRVSPWEVMS